MQTCTRSLVHHHLFGDDKWRYLSYGISTNCASGCIVFIDHMAWPRRFYTHCSMLMAAWPKVCQSFPVPGTSAEFQVRRVSFQSCWCWKSSTNGPHSVELNTWSFRKLLETYLFTPSFQLFHHLLYYEMSTGLLCMWLNVPSSPSHYKATALLLFCSLEHAGPSKDVQLDTWPVHRSACRNLCNPLQQSFSVYRFTSHFTGPE